MALFEYHNIETLIGDDGSPIKDVLLSFGGVVLGFGLSELASLTRTRNKRKKSNQAFQFEIEQLEVPLKTQIENNKKLIEQITRNEYVAPVLNTFKSIEFIRLIDRMEVYEYNKRKFSEEHLKKIRTIYNTLDLIEIEIKRFESTYNEFSQFIDLQYALYKKIADKFTRFIADYELKNRMNYSSDEFFLKVVALISNTLHKEERISNIFDFESSLHKELLKEKYEKHDHPIYSSVTEFNQAAFDIYTAIRGKTEVFINKITIITSSLEKCYSNIF